MSRDVRLKDLKLDGVSRQRVVVPGPRIDVARALHIEDTLFP